MATPEGRIKRKVSNLLKRLPHCYYFMPVQTGLGATTLDYLGCCAGHFFAIETKKDNKSKLTPRQLITKAKIEAVSGTVFLVYDDESLTQMHARLNLMILHPAAELWTAAGACNYLLHLSNSELIMERE